MKITIQPTEDQSELPANLAMNTVSVESPRDDVTVPELVELFKAALLAAEFPVSSVERIELKPD